MRNATGVVKKRKGQVKYRTSGEIRIVIARHAEALKNLQGIQGGGAQELTPRGHLQAAQIRTLWQRELETSQGSGIVAHQPENRCLSTANIVVQGTNSILQEMEELAGAGMGVTAGLTPKELTDRYPMIAREQARWRAGMRTSVPISPRGEPLEVFSDRISSGILHMLERADRNRVTAVIAVCTTSTLTMMSHLLQNDGELLPNSYCFEDLKLGQVVSWVISSDRPPQQVR